MVARPCWGPGNRVSTQGGSPRNARGNARHAPHRRVKLRPPVGPLLVIASIALILVASCGRERPTQPHLRGRAAARMAQLPSAGLLKLGVVQVNFNDLAFPPGNGMNDVIEGMLFNDEQNVRGLYQEMSYGRLDFEY